MKKYLVTRAGWPGNYQPGWFALSFDGVEGAHFPTWLEAITFALNRSTR